MVNSVNVKDEGKMQVNPLVMQNDPQHITVGVLKEDIQEEKTYAKEYPKLKEFFDLMEDSFKEKLAYLEGRSTKGDPSQKELEKQMMDFCKKMHAEGKQLVEEILACLEGKPGSSHENLGVLLGKFAALESKAGDLAKSGFSMGPITVTPVKES